MFIVGATGQLLTLALTAGLLLILLVSGHQKVELDQNNKRFEVNQVISPFNFNLKEDASSFTLVAHETVQQNLIKLHSPCEKNPPIFYMLEWHGAELTGSGNKAAPLFI